MLLHRSVWTGGDEEILPPGFPPSTRPLRRPGCISLGTCGSLPQSPPSAALLAQACLRMSGTRTVTLSVSRTKHARKEAVPVAT